MIPPLTISAAPPKVGRRSATLREGAEVLLTGRTRPDSCMAPGLDEDPVDVAVPMHAQLGWGY